MKKVLVLLALLAAVCGLLTFSAAAESAAASGICGENLTWTLDAAGTLTVSGTGAMKDYNYKGAPWYQSRDSIKAVVIENGVTAIGERAFNGCSSLTSITIPESVTTIGGRAFEDCTSLTSITIPESVTAIGSGAFFGCDSLTDVSITDLAAWCRIDFANDSATFIFANGSATPMRYAKNIWLDGQKIVSVTVPEGVTEVKAYTFCGFKDLIRVTIPAGVTAIGKNAFSGCSSLSSITLPEGVTAIGDGAFQDCSSLTSITIPESVTAIGNSAFYCCSSLTGITIPEGVTTIGDRAFFYCISLTSITIPERVTIIGNGAFSNCSSLTDVSITDLDAWCRIDFADYSATPMQYAKNIWLDGQRIVSVTMPEGVTEVKAYTFYGFQDLIQVTIPESVTTIGDYAFEYCSSLSSINIPESVTTIGKTAFYECSSLTEIEIPESVTVIQKSLFDQASGLRRVALPKGLKGVAANAFYGCTKIQEVFYAGSETEWNALPIATGNDPLKNATIYYNSTLDDYYCRITVAASEGGRVAVSANTVKTGDTVTVTATPYRGYALSAIYVDEEEISGDTFIVTGNHRVSAVFTRLPIVGGNEDFRLEGITVLDGAGNLLQELPAERLLVTVAVRHLKESGGGTVMLAQYDEKGRYQGLLWLTLEEMPQDMTLKVTLPVDNTGGSIAQLKVFLVESLLSPAPVGEAISFGTI